MDDDDELTDEVADTKCKTHADGTSNNEAENLKRRTKNELRLAKQLSRYDDQHPLPS